MTMPASLPRRFAADRIRSYCLTKKAHPDVLNILLQILDDGRITDSHGKTVNFENTIIVMTTNAGSNLNLNSLGFATVEQSKWIHSAPKRRCQTFAARVFNRVDEIITFRQLDEGDFVKIAKLMLDDLAKALSERGMLGHTDAAAEFIAKSSFSINTARATCGAISSATSRTRLQI